MSRHITFGFFSCKCGQKIRAAGFAIYNHMEAHVRRGEAKCFITRSARYDWEWLVKNPQPIRRTNRAR